MHTQLHTHTHCLVLEVKNLDNQQRPWSQIHRNPAQFLLRHICFIAVGWLFSLLFFCFFFFSRMNTRWEKMVFLLSEWWSTGTACPEKLWSFLLWRYPRPIWTPTCVTWWRECALAGCYTGSSLEVPSNSCDSVILWLVSQQYAGQWYWFCNKTWKIQWEHAESLKKKKKKTTTSYRDFCVASR